MALSLTAIQDALAVSVFLGGAFTIFVITMCSYMGLFSIFSRNLSTFYSGKHVLITGGSSGIGKDLARILLNAGASVTLVARNRTKLEAAARELEPPGESHATNKRVNFLSADCADPNVVEQMADQVERNYGPVDILVNSAGAGHAGYFETMDPSTFRTMMNTNYFTCVFTTQTFFKRMVSRRAGHVVMLSSVAGQIPVFGYSAYCPAKFAVRGFAETLFFEAKPYNINVSIVYPPDTDTPGLKNERISMPPETLQIGESAGLFQSDKVARAIANGIMRNQFRISIGVIGSLASIVSAGVTPVASLLDIIVLPFARAISPLIIWDQMRIIRNGHAARMSISNDSHLIGSHDAPRFSQHHKN